MLARGERLDHDHAFGELVLADALAIHAGTWTIDPAQSFGVFLGGVLPIEEFAFFLMTNVLLTSGIVLLWAEESHERFAVMRRWLAARRAKAVAGFYESRN